MDELEKIRQQINGIDQKILNLLRKRFLQIQKIKKLKNSKKLKFRDKNREEEILSKMKTDYEKRIFKKILLESRKT